MKRIRFIGSSLKDIQSFPVQTKKEIGVQLDRLQHGSEPQDWKPMRNVGPGTREIRIRTDGAFRVIYVAKFKEAIYVLHAFRKKSFKTAKKDIDLGKKRYKEMIRTRSE